MNGIGGLVLWIALLFGEVEWTQCFEHLIEILSYIAQLNLNYNVLGKI